MVLSDKSIGEEVASGRLVIEPFDPDCVQPASVDLHLDRRFRAFRTSRQAFVDVREPSEDLTELVEIEAEEPYIIHPGEFVLGSTIETVTLPDDLVARLDGKSSLGRLGLVVHATAGYVDPGFSGKLTLELSNAGKMPIALHYEMRIAQISFLRLSTPVERPYGSPGLGSKYQGQQEPTPSRAYRDFSKTIGGKARGAPKSAAAMLPVGLRSFVTSGLGKSSRVAGVRVRQVDGLFDFLVCVKGDLYRAESDVISVFAAAMARYPEVAIEFMVCRQGDVAGQTVKTWGTPLAVR